MPTFGMADITPAGATKRGDFITSTGLTIVAICSMEDTCMGGVSNASKESTNIRTGAFTQTSDFASSIDTISHSVTIITKDSFWNGSLLEISILFFGLLSCAFANPIQQTSYCAVSF
jgi:hypothetical protein